VLLDGGVIQNLQNEVQFGLQMYANPSDIPGCPNLEGVPYALANFGPIQSTLGPAGTQPDTPTGESILEIAGITDAGVVVSGGLAELDAGGGEKIILLVTDGDPDYCGNPQANDQGDAGEIAKAKAIAVDAVKRAYASGIKTYVLAIGSEVSIPHQQEMANAGQGLPANEPDAAPLFRPTDEAQLQAQINSIIYGARPCSYTLNGAVQAGSEDKGTVALNGQALGYGDPDGWRLASPTELELVGQACETVKTSESATLTAHFPCGAFVVR
jgi:hypothetical protein